MAIDHAQADLCGCVRPTACVDRNGGCISSRSGGSVPTATVEFRTGEMSDRLDVAPSSVTEMFERLAAAGFLNTRNGPV